MAQPSAYVRQYNFTTFQAANPLTPLPAIKVDLELNTIKITLDEVLANLKLIQRDDTAIANNSISYSQLAPEVLIALGNGIATTWATATAYKAKAFVWQANNLYICNTDHTSGVFATDLAAVRWTLATNYNTPLTQAQASAAAALASETNAAASAADALTSENDAAASAVAAAASAAAAASFFGSLTLPLPVSLGGHGGSTVGQARSNLQVAFNGLVLTAGTGLTGGGDLTANRTFSLANTSVTAGPYGSALNSPTFTVDAQGRLTAAANVAIAIPVAQITNMSASARTFNQTTLPATFTTFAAQTTQAAMRATGLGISDGYDPNNQLLINGACAIDQPNAGASVVVGASTYLRDGLVGALSGAGGFSWQRTTNVNLLTTRNPVITCDRYTVTAAAAAPGAGDFYNAGMRIEGLRASRLQYGRASARRAWLCATARSSIAWTLSGALQSSTADRSFMWSFPLLANTTHDIAIDITGCVDGTWNVDNTVGLTVRVCLGVGSTFSGVAGSWQAANRIGVAGAGLMATLGATLDITAWELVIGDVAPPFYIPPDPALELARCMREYEKSFAIGTAPAQNVGAATGETRWPVVLAGASVNRSNRVRFAVPKRATPVITLYNPGAANAQVRDFSLPGDCSASSAPAPSDSGFDINCTANAASGAQNWLGVHWAADARL